MSSSDPEPEQSADNDARKASESAVWDDLVARLEAMDSSAGPGMPPAPGAGPAADTPRDPEAPELPRRFPAGPPAGGEQSGPGNVSPPGPLPLSGRPLSGPPLSGPPLPGPRDYAEPDADDDDEGFEPDEPGPVGTGNPLVVLAWAGAVAAPVLLLLASLVWRNASSAVVFGLLAVFVASVVYLFLRLPREHDEHDDGARL